MGVFSLKYLLLNPNDQGWFVIPQGVFPRRVYLWEMIQLVAEQRDCSQEQSSKQTHVNSSVRLRAYLALCSWPCGWKQIWGMLWRGQIWSRPVNVGKDIRTRFASISVSKTLTVDAIVFDANLTHMWSLGLFISIDANTYGSSKPIPLHLNISR